MMVCEFRPVMAQLQLFVIAEVGSGRNCFYCEKIGEELCLPDVIEDVKS